MSARPVVLVTGALRGIGRGIALALANGGFDIAVTDLAEEGSDECREIAALAAERGAAFHYVRSDLGDLASHQPAVDAVLSRFVRIDCLVNNAGMASVVRGDFLELDPVNFDRIVSVNLRGTVFFTQAVASAMLATTSDRQRTIITVTSVSAELSSPERLDYCITKAGLSSFVKGLALRLADSGISVFEVRPGIIRTGMTAGVATKYDGLIADGLVPMRRWGEADDIGAVCASLASGGFAFATGSVINADGGLSIGRL